MSRHKPGFSAATWNAALEDDDDARTQCFSETYVSSCDEEETEHAREAGRALRAAIAEATGGGAVWGEPARRLDRLAAGANGSLEAMVGAIRAQARRAGVKISPQGLVAMLEELVTSGGLACAGPDLAAVERRARTLRSLLEVDPDNESYLQELAECDNRLHVDR